MATRACDLGVALGDLVAGVAAVVGGAPPLLLKKSALKMDDMLALSVGSQHKAA